MAVTSLKDRLFSPDMPNSLTATLIRNAPTNTGPGSFMAALFKQVASLPSGVMLAFSPNARAATYIDYSNIAGGRWYGALPSDLAEDTAPEVRQEQVGQVKCPEISPEVGWNRCIADTVVIHDLTCSQTPDNCPEWKQQ